ncbi:MAG: SIMPL domain-containing protein [Anaerolineales bacterium]
MFKKSVILVALLALFLAGCSGATGVASGGYSGGPAVGLSVNGRGQVSLQPDIAYVTIGVHTEAGEVSEAVSQNADQVGRVMEALADMGIARVDMQTSNFSLYTGDRYDPATGLSLGKNYSVDNTVNVTVRDLANMGEILDGAISAGANSIWGVSFDLEDKSAAQAEARDMALADAMAEGQALSAAAELTLGDILSLSYTDSGYYYPPAYGMGGGGGGADVASTSIVPGMITVSAEVYITYAIR